MYFIKKTDLVIQLYKKEIVKYNKQLNSTFHFLGFKFKFSNLVKFAVVLNCVYGIGYKKYVKFFISKFGFSFNSSIIFISIFIFQKLQLNIRSLFLNYDLKKFISNNIFIKKKYKLYGGYRHSLFLSVRGQRSKTNCGTQKKKKIKTKK